MLLYQIRNIILFVLLMYQTLELSISRKISIKNNGYRDIKVLLPREVPMVNKSKVVRAVEDLFTSASTTLYIATKRRAHFADVTLVVPNTWGPKEEWLPDSSANISYGTLNPYDEANVKITTEMEGTKPLTLHAGGCGEQATRILIPMELLLSGEDTESKSREFVHHWAQYRYGIFPEGGFQSDPRYPLYYSIPGTKEVEITACTGIPLNYTMVNTDGSACEAKVAENTGRSVGSECVYTTSAQSVSSKSSLMYQQSLYRMSQFCHGETELDKVHNVAAPSKHNTLCGEESTWFVILRNQDFSKGRNQATKYRPLPTKFKYVQQSSFKVVVALETSAHMNINSRYSLVKNALTKLILYDLPPGTQFGLVSYSDEETAMESLLTLESKESRQRYLETIPFQEDAGPHFNRCSTCAVEAGIELLQNDGYLEEEGEIIILITTDCPENFGVNSSSPEEIKEKLLMKDIKIFVMAFSQDQNSSCDWESFSSATGGHVYHIPESFSPNTMITFMYLAFASIFKGYSLPSITETLVVEEIPADQMNVSLPFHVGSSIDKELRVIITGSTFGTQNSPLVADATGVRCGFDEDFTEFERQHFMPAWVFDIVSHQGPNCTFETKRKEGTSDPVLVIITQKWQEEEKPVTVHAFLNHENQTIRTVGQSALKIFITIKAGIQPIIGAEVSVSAYHPDGYTSEMYLIDDGVGDPDVTRNDGIYSTYFTNYSAEGHYSFLFKISSKEGTRKLEVDASNCCGSFMPSKSIEEMEDFTRLVGPVSILLTEKSLEEDVYPPNQIFDVRVTDTDLELRKYTLQWTAAGDDYNQGTASGYELKVFSDRTELRYNFGNTGLEIDLLRDVVHYTPPAEYGNLQQFVVRLPNVSATGTYYFGVRALDDAGNYGLVSNSVPVFLRSVMKKEKSCDDDNDHADGGGVRYKSSVCVILNLILLLYILSL